ncbi:MAG: phosphate ABC transporter permease subunit PstC [Ignavibacteria bacterium]|jgi:phosphate transport system permease protein
MTDSGLELTIGSKPYSVGAVNSRVRIELKRIKKFRLFDWLFKKSLGFSSILFVMIIIGIFLTLLIQSIPSIKEFGLSYYTHSTWNPVEREFGSLPFLVGTVITSFLALIITIPFSLSISLFLGEYFRKGAPSTFLRNAVEILGGIPSVIYGFWGLFFLVPIMRSLEVSLGLPSLGIGIFTTSILLFIMIIPYSASIGREVISMVPNHLKEAAYSLGATKYEVIRSIVLPYARSGIFAGILLALGRALGETMAVTMVIGNRNALPTSIFSPANTMASVIANEFTEATGDVYVSSLIQIGLLLFVVTTIINIAGKKIIKQFGKTQ